MRKKIQFLVLAVILALAAFSVWYVFEEAARISDLDQEPEEEFREVKPPEDAEPVAELEQVPKRIPFDPEDLEEKEFVALPENIEPKEPDKKRSLIESVQDYLLTNYIIQDLAEYITAHYHPPGTQKNPGSEGRSRLCFKALNARYGLELTGFRYTEDEPDEVRQKVLDWMMDSEVLKKFYEQYVDDFLEQLLAQAQGQKWKFVNSGGEHETRGLQEEELVEFLKVKSDYMLDVASILQQLVQDKETARLVQEYLDHEQQTVHANYVLNQKQNRLRVLRRELEQEKNREEELHEKIARAEENKQEAAANYREAIQQREKTREDLMEDIKSNARPRGLENHEILYIAEWVQRRFVQGQNEGAVRMLAELFEDFDQRALRKAQEIK